MTQLQFILLMIALGLYTIGVIIQTSIVNKTTRGYKFISWILLFFVVFFGGILFAPFTWAIILDNIEERTLFISYGEFTQEKRVALEGLGFTYYDHRVSDHYIPYRGMLYVDNHTRIIIALDNHFQADEKDYMRVSLTGRKTKVAKYLLKRIKQIDEGTK